MCRLERAIYALGQRDWFDYLAVVAPLVLSIVAIWISISVARKQNRIALFNIKCDALHTISWMISFGEELSICGCSESVIDLFNATFGTLINIEPNDPIDASREAINRMYSIEKDILSAKYVFSKDDFSLLEKIWEEEQDYICYVIEVGFSEEKQQKIQELCAEYRKEYYVKLEQKTRL